MLCVVCACFVRVVCCVCCVYVCMLCVFVLCACVCVYVCGTCATDTTNHNILARHALGRLSTVRIWSEWVWGCEDVEWVWGCEDVE